INGGLAQAKEIYIYAHGSASDTINDQSIGQTGRKIRIHIKCATIGVKDAAAAVGEGYSVPRHSVGIPQHLILHHNVTRIIDSFTAFYTRKGSGSTSGISCMECASIVEEVISITKVSRPTRSYPNVVVGKRISSRFRHNVAI